MKICWKNLCLSACFILLSIASSLAQCGTLQSVTYDTTVAGTGNNTHVFTLSKFDPSVGTLMSAKINSVISVNYGFTLKNVEDVHRDFSVAVGRYDNFSSAALSTPYTNSMNIPLGSFPLDPGNSVSEVPSNILSRFVQTDSLVYNMANFLGSGTIDYNYTPITYTNLTGSNVYYYSATASDTIRFSITYFYCTASVLPISIINFFAKKEDQETIQLSWKTLNELAGRTYEIEKSEDGNTFSVLASELSVTEGDDADYLYNYTINKSDNNKIFFRIKMINSSDVISYSDIREVDLDNNTGNISLYPNPSSDFINVSFNQPQTSNWDINIYSSNGILIQNNYASNVNSFRIPFQHKLASGSYIMQIVNKRTQQNYAKRFTIVN